MDIIPGIYENDVEELDRKISLVSDFTNWIQIDVSDGTFVEKKSISDWMTLQKIISKYPNLSFEAHLMVDKPEKFISGLAKAGFKRLIAHVESSDPRIFLDEITYESVESGLAIDASTEFEEIEPFLDSVDIVLVMTAEAGASGKQMQMETLEKIKTIKERYPDITIEVDCGINDHTIRLVREAGASRATVTSFLFNNEKQIKSAFDNLKKVTE